MLQIRQGMGAHGMLGSDMDDSERVKWQQSYCSAWPAVQLLCWLRPGCAVLWGRPREVFTRVTWTEQVSQAGIMGVEEKIDLMPFLGRGGRVGMGTNKGPRDQSQGTRRI